MKAVSLVMSILILVLSLPSCGKEGSSSYNELCLILEDGSKIYTFSGDDGEAGRKYCFPSVPIGAEDRADLLDCHLAASLFGSSDTEVGEYPPEFSLVRDGALWISSREAPRELTVLQIHSSRDTTTVAKMLLRRADAIKVYCAMEGLTLIEARVYVSGCFVILSVITQEQAP